MDIYHTTIDITIHKYRMSYKAAHMNQMRSLTSLFNWWWWVTLIKKVNFENCGWKALKSSVSMHRRYSTSYTLQHWVWSSFRSLSIDSITVAVIRYLLSNRQGYPATLNLCVVVSSGIISISIRYIIRDWLVQQTVQLSHHKTDLSKIRL